MRWTPLAQDPNRAFGVMKRETLRDMRGCSARGGDFDFPIAPLTKRPFSGGSGSPSPVRESSRPLSPTHMGMKPQEFKLNGLGGWLEFLDTGFIPVRRTPERRASGAWFAATALLLSAAAERKQGSLGHEGHDAAFASNEARQDTKPPPNGGGARRQMRTWQWPIEPPL